MAALILPSRRVVQPPDAEQVIDRRVTRAILPQALGVVDLANGGGITVSGSGFSRAANGQGYGLRNNSLTRANYVNVTKRTEESTSITIVWTGVVHQTGGVTYPFFRSGQTIIHATAATNAMWGCRFGTTVNANSTTPIKLGVPTTYVFTQTGSVGSLFVDGVAALLNVTGGTLAIGASHGIDGNIGFTQSNDITTNAFFILDKGVSIGEARELSLNPWQLFKPIERRIWVPVASGGGGGQTLSPSLLTRTKTIYGPSASVGPITLSLTLLTRTKVLHDPSVSQSGAAQTVSPGLLTRTKTIYSPVLVQGEVDLLPTLLIRTKTIHEPSVSTRTSLTPGPLTRAKTVYGPTIKVGGVALSPSLLTRSKAIYFPTLMGGDAPIATGGLFWPTARRRRR